MRQLVRLENHVASCKTVFPCTYSGIIFDNIRAFAKPSSWGIWAELGEDQDFRRSS